MPTYDYVCSKCGHRMEVLHGVHERGPAECPVCGGPMKKAFSPPTIHFKGTGWAKKERRATVGTHRKAKETSETATADGASDGAGASKPTGGSAGGDPGSASSSTSGTPGPSSTD